MRKEVLQKPVATHAAVIPQIDFDALSDSALIKKPFIIGDKKRGITGVIPMSNTAWYEGIREKIYPAPIKLGGGRSVAWRVGAIRELLAKLEGG